MENRRLVGILPILLFFIFVFFNTAKTEAYAVSTHAEITKAILETYERKYGDTFSDTEQSVIAKGSKDEDDAGRFLNHFYDPVSGRGILKNDASPTWADDVIGQANWGLRKLGINGLKTTEPLFSGVQDYTWERAVYEYVHGDKERGLEALGHILHLLEDATVPAHVRDDLHPYQWGLGDKDNHEDFDKGFTVNDVNTKNVKALTFETIEQALEDTAMFTQQNFMSKDTLFKDYKLPKRVDLSLESSHVDGDDQYFGKGNFGKVVRIKQWRDKTQKGAPEREEYFLTDKENKILTENWEVLSNHAVAAGVGAIDLFFRDVQQERQTGKLLAMNKSRIETERFVKALAFVRDSKKSMLTSLAAADVYELNKDDLDGYFNAAKLYGIPVPVVARESVLKEDVQNRQPASALTGFEQATKSKSIIGEPIPAGTPPLVEVREEPIDATPIEVVETVIIEEDGVAEETEPKENIEEEKAEDAPTNNLSPFDPGGYGYGGGGGGSAIVEESEPVVTVVPSAPVVTSPVEGVYLATSTVTFSGTGLEGNIITGVVATTTATTTVLAGDIWSLGPFVLAENAMTSATFTQTDSDGNESTETILQITTDTVSPDSTALSALECTHSLRNDGGCLAGSTKVHVVWDAVDDVSFYEVQIGGVLVATTTATTTVVSLDDQQTSDITIITYDEAGNSAESNTISVEVFANPIVISEIAWGGTVASTDDEWLELYNRTSYELDLSEVQIRTEDNASLIALSGTIPTGSSWNKRTYIVERGDGTATTKKENLALDFDRFSDNGNQLILELATDDFTTELDSTPEVSACNGWCGGINTGKFYTMERKNVDISGSESTNWQSNDGYNVVNEYYDARGYEYGVDHKVYGTVGQENSKGYPEIGYFCAPYTESFEEGGTYSPTVPANLTIANCTYLNSLWGSGSYAGSVYLGIVGSSTVLTGHSIFGIKSDQNGDIIDSLENGDNIFVAFWKNYTGSSHASDGQQFVDYMTGVGTTTPHSDFRVLNWIYSE